MIGKCCIVEGDLYGIGGRVKEIDPAYFIVRNYEKKRFELHASGQNGGTLCLVIPYPVLDGRTVTLTRKTRVERKKALLQKMEQDNARLEAEKMRSLLKMLREKFL